MISILLLWPLYVIKIGPVKFQRQAEQLWHWLVEQEVVHCRSLPLQKYELSQPKVILCHLSLNNNSFACWPCLRKMTLTTNQGRWFRSTDYCCLRGWTEQRLDRDFRVDSFTGGERFDGHRNQHQGFGQQQTAAIPSEFITSTGPAKKHTVNNHKKSVSTAVMISHLILHRASAKCWGGKAQVDSYQTGFEVFLSETITFNTRSIKYAHVLQ